jgi:hypothetical protein
MIKNNDRATMKESKAIIPYGQQLPRIWESRWWWFRMLSG